MKTRLVDYQDNDLTCEAYFASPDESRKHPCVLIAHAWAGQSDFEREKAEAIAEVGYNAFAIDMYGKGVRGNSVEENQALIAPFMGDRALLRQRILAALDAAKALDCVDTNNVAVIGYCFGGLCALDVARSGADIKGAVSIHGLFAPPNIANGLIKAKILALHGYDDPMVPPDQVLALAKEMTDAGADWQIHAYGLTQHAFTNPEANNPDLGTIYNETANRRSWQSLQNFLAELFA